MTERVDRWRRLIGRDVCITTADESACGVVTEIVEDEAGVWAVFDWGMAARLTDETTVEPVATPPPATSERAH